MRSVQKANLMLPDGTECLFLGFALSFINATIEYAYDILKEVTIPSFELVCGRTYFRL